MIKTMLLPIKCSVIFSVSSKFEVYVARFGTKQ